MVSEAKLMKIEIECEHCNGQGWSVSHVECDGGGITESEMSEILYDDPNFYDDYMGGEYDKSCYACKGSGTLTVERYVFVKYGDDEE